MRNNPGYLLPWKGDGEVWDTGEWQARLDLVIPKTGGRRLCFLSFLL